MLSITKRFFSQMSKTSHAVIDFEVFGKVQGVFFRKYTQKKAKELGLTGWCRNTENDSVVGQAEGQREKIEAMKTWLCKEGSPASRIEKCIITENTTPLNLKEFEVRY